MDMMWLLLLYWKYDVVTMVKESQGIGEEGTVSHVTEEENGYVKLMYDCL